MDKKLEERLVSDFPQIFQDYGCSPGQSPMAFGLDVGNGWEPLIRKLCADIMETHPPKEFKAEQVKEKYGSLRFYHSGANDEQIINLIDQAMDDSYYICEKCGSKDGAENKEIKGWYMTLCISCRKEALSG